MPANSHNLLAFTYDGVRYSTGVNNALLSAPPSPNPAVTFVPQVFNAITVSALPGTLTTNTKLGLGALYDGVNNGASNPAPSAALSYYLIDGVQGLNIGTGIANLPIGTLRFDVSNIQLSSIGDGVPDILVTQYANPSSSTDRYSFRNAANQIVGTEVSVNLSSLNVLGNWTADFYETTPTRTLQSGFTQTNRPLRLWAADISQFGVTPANYASITTFQITLGGESDQAFVAYNVSTFALIPDELPGGVGKQPSLWLKANNGPSTTINNAAISDWADKSGKNNNASQSTSGLRPTYRSSGSNFNPTANFGAHYLSTFQNITVGDGQPYVSFVVAKQNTATAKTLLGSTGSSTSVRQSLSAASVPSVLHGATNVFPTSAPTYGTNNTRIWTTSYRGAAGNRLLLDMSQSQSNTVSANFVNRPSQIGSHQSAAATGNADISEVITYPTTLTDNEIQRVNTYLAVKYGITLANNYLSCNSVQLYPSDGAGATELFDNRIFGIGRENCQLLNQKQAKSIAAGALFTIGAGDSIASDNNANPSILNDAAYLLLGDNNLSLSWGTGTTGGTINSRMARNWKVVATGTPGSIKIRIPSFSSSEATKLDSIPPLGVPFLLIKTANDDFSTGFTTVPLTLVGTNYETNYTFPSGTQFISFGYTIVNPLPVELVSFDAIADHTKREVDLVWTTASEINNAYFTIEKSVDGMDWRLVGHVDGAGNSNELKNYKLLDPAPSEGLSYYRLKQTDYDGTETLEGIRSVNFAPNVVFKVYPNPSTDLLYIEGENIQSVEVYSVSAQLLKIEQQQAAASWTLQTETWANGIYYLKIRYNDNQFKTEKVVIER